VQIVQIARPTGFKKLKEDERTKKEDGKTFQNEDGVGLLHWLIDYSHATAHTKPASGAAGHRDSLALAPDRYRLTVILQIEF
jgi:aspartyl aminopeptidase